MTTRYLLRGVRFRYSIDGMRRGVNERQNQPSSWVSGSWRRESHSSERYARVRNLKFWKSNSAANIRWSETENRNNLHLKSQLSGIGNSKARTMPTLFFFQLDSRNFCFQAVAVFTGLCNGCSMRDGQIDDSDCKQQKLVHR